MNAIITPCNGKWLIVFMSGGKVCDCFEVSKIDFEDKFPIKEENI